jgi:hypothetical protein
MPEVRISFCGRRIVSALTLAVSNCRGFWNKMDKTRGPTGAGHPLAKSSLCPGPERKDLGEIRTPANECYAPGDQGTAFFLGPVTKRGHIRTAIYWPRIMWLTRSETGNDLETPDARTVDADRFHCVGPRWRDLHFAHHRSQAAINLWYAARGRQRGFAG